MSNKSNPDEIIDLDAMEDDTHHNNHSTRNQDKRSASLDRLKGVWSISRLKGYAKSTRKCPYFMSKYLIQKAQIVIYSYNYLLDPKIANNISKKLNPKTIVIFDEAHNIDQVCVEAMTVKVGISDLKKAKDQCVELKNNVEMTFGDEMGRDISRFSDLTLGNDGVDSSVFPYSGAPVTNDKIKYTSLRLFLKSFIIILRVSLFQIKRSI